MGTWGIGLTDDDLTADIVGDFMDRFNKGENPADIRRALEKSYEHTIGDSDEGHMFWFALAKAQWDIGALDADILKKVRHIIESETDAKVWLELGATNAVVTKRKVALQKFLSKIEVPNEKPKKVKKIRLKDAHYEAGDVITFKTPDDYFGVAVVVSADKQKEYPANKVVILGLKQKEEPSIEVIMNANLIMSRRRDFGVALVSFLTQYRKKVYEEFKIIGRVRVKVFVDRLAGVYAGWWFLPGSLSSDYFISHTEVKQEQPVSLKDYLGYEDDEEIEVIKENPS